MFGLPARVLLASAAVFLSATVEAADDAHTLPIFFFHGLTGNATHGRNFKANLSTDARPLVPLSFCENECSFTDLNVQAQLAIKQIRGIVANDTRFDRGYSFIGHSQGGALARLVIEEMDDHKVHTFISLAGIGNGIFYGPQENDFFPARQFIHQFAPFIKEPDYSKYTDADITSGKFALDMTKWNREHPDKQLLQSRSPATSDWIRYNTLFPKLNNLQETTSAEIAADKARRKANYLKLKEAHYFGSMFDETVSPWQSSLNGEYESVASFEELEAKYKELKVVPMVETPEYVQDLYGLQTLDKRGGLFLHAAEHVSHDCWAFDSLSPRDGLVCHQHPVFEKYVYPLVAPVVTYPPVQNNC